MSPGQECHDCDDDNHNDVNNVNDDNNNDANNVNDDNNNDVNNVNDDVDCEWVLRMSVTKNEIEREDNLPQDTKNEMTRNIRWQIIL